MTESFAKPKPEMIGGKRIPIMVRIHGPMKVNQDALGNVDCSLHEAKDYEHEEGNYFLKLGESYYDATFSIAEGEWIGSSFSFCESCKDKFIAESEATRQEIVSEAMQEARKKVGVRKKEWYAKIAKEQVTEKRTSQEFASFEDDWFRDEILGD